MTVVENTKEAAFRLGISATHLRNWMWAHGFDPIGKDGLVFLWSREQIDQMIQERIRWKFVRPVDDGTVRIVEVNEHVWEKDQNPISSVPSPRPSLTWPIPRESIPLDSEKLERNRQQAATRTKQLESAPVDVKDIDYLASRAGHRRRRGQTLGITEMMVKERR